MKRTGGLWSRLIRFDNLLLAYRKARKGKQQRPEVAQFSLNLEAELFGLQQSLMLGRYVPGRYRQFRIYERKPRVISAAPFRDRVVHHALMNVAEPVLDRTFIHDSYACRQRKGVHAAVKRYQQWSGRYAYVLKLDIARYFPSIDHAILWEQLTRKLKDKAVLGLFGTILEHGPQHPNRQGTFPQDDLLSGLSRKVGLPIGNLTSQVLANLYLNDLDHFIKERLRATAYLRYVDDLAVLSDDKTQLHDWREQIEQFLRGLRLRVHPAKVNVFKTGCGIDFLGYQVFPGYIRLRNDNGFRFLRKLRRFSQDYYQGMAEWGDFNPSVQSWIGHAGQADTKGLRQAIFDDVIFSKQWGYQPAIQTE